MVGAGFVISLRGEGIRMSALQTFNDERTIRARKIVKAARLNLIGPCLSGHVSRADRVADALATARRTVARLDPKRLAREQLQRDAAAARQSRAKRTLNAARATLKRLAQMQVPSRALDEIVPHKTAENARVAPISPSPTSRWQNGAMPPTCDGIDDLRHRIEVLREAVPEAMGQLVADLRTELQREDDLLRRELDVMRREIDLARRVPTASTRSR
jgi:hypothetical protein